MLNYSEFIKERNNFERSIGGMGKYGMGNPYFRLEFSQEFRYAREGREFEGTYNINGESKGTNDEQGKDMLDEITEIMGVETKDFLIWFKEKFGFGFLTAGTFKAEGEKGNFNSMKTEATEYKPHMDMRIKIS